MFLFCCSSYFLGWWTLFETLVLVILSLKSRQKGILFKSFTCGKRFKRDSSVVAFSGWQQSFLLLESAPEKIPSFAYTFSYYMLFDTYVLRSVSTTVIFWHFNCRPIVKFITCFLINYSVPNSNYKTWPIPRLKRNWRQCHIFCLSCWRRHNCFLFRFTRVCSSSNLEYLSRLTFSVQLAAGPVWLAVADECMRNTILHTEA